MAATVRAKPRLRGVFHELGFYAAVGLAVPLIATAEPGRARLAALVFALCVALCFGASALYHRPTWTPNVRGWLARLDHAGIYLLIAGTYTPFGLLVFSRNWAIPVLAIVWGGALTGIVLKLFWLHLPKRVSAVIGLVLGWTGAVAFSQLLKLPAPAVALVVIAGVAYSIGALTYAFKRPDPIPALFGYHEVFHLWTLLAVGCDYAAIAFYVLPRA